MQCDSTSPLSRETDAPETIVKLECDIDDASPEVLAYAADRLREAGAREVHWLPLYCKKGRPGWQLQVICTLRGYRAPADDYLFGNHDQRHPPPGYGARLPATPL